VDKAKLATMHRVIGEAEHGVERRMLDQADRLPHPETVRERAHEISARADRHLADARRLSGDDNADRDHYSVHDGHGGEE